MRLIVVLACFTLAARLSAQEPAIFEPGAKLKVEAEGEGAGEGPAWHPKLGVLTSGGNGHMQLFGLDGKVSIHKKNAGTNGLLFDQAGNLVACEHAARRMTRTDPEGKVTILTDNYMGKKYNNPNDLTIDSKGRIYFTDPRYGKRDGMEILDRKGQTIEGVYRLDAPLIFPGIDPGDKKEPQWKVSRIIARELERPNGILVSADDKYLFVADNNNSDVTGARKLWRLDRKSVV